jgi:hypothetical protein
MSGMFFGEDKMSEESVLSLIRLGEKVWVFLRRLRNCYEVVFLTFGKVKMRNGSVRQTDDPLSLENWWVEKSNQFRR